MRSWPGGDRDGPHAEFPQVTLDRGLAVAAAGGDRGWHAASTPADALDGGRELGPIGGGAELDTVVQDDAVVVAGGLGLAAELDRVAAR